MMAEVNSCAEATSNNFKEVIIRVPKQFALMPLGFSLDAGGSVTKIVYRSKEDYNNGQQIETNAEYGKLRMRHFKMRDADGLMDFLQRHCDVIVDKNSQLEWCQTGVQFQQIRTAMHSTFNIRTKIVEEFTAQLIAFKSVFRNISASEFLPLPVSGVQPALQLVRTMMTMMQQMEQASTTPLALMPSTATPEEQQRCAMKLMTVSAEDLARELSSATLQYPCLMVQCGSATACMLVKEDGNLEFTDSFTSAAGRTYWGLGRLLTGAKDYDELLAMAARGDSNKVDVSIMDLRDRLAGEADMYSMMTDDMPVFCLGKLVESRYDGQYTKDDLAAGLLDMICIGLAKLACSTARISHIRSVVFCGSFVDNDVTREKLTRAFLVDTLMQPLRGDNQVMMHFIPNSSFLVALGVWHQNLKMSESAASV